MTAPMQYPVRFRDGRPSDHALVINSWMESERVQYPNSQLPKALVCSLLRSGIERALKHGRLSIAHDFDDADSIYAYLVWETTPLTWKRRQDESPEAATTLHFAYTKGVFRRRGFIARLIRHAIPDFGKHTIFTTTITHHRQPTLRDAKGEPVGQVDGDEYKQTWHATAQAHRLVYQPLLSHQRAERAATPPEAA